jgi:enolase-phosphatase E1
MLLDIEGTLSPFAFVHQEMFPYVRRCLADYLTEHQDSTELRTTCAQVLADAAGEQVSSCDLADPATQRRVVAAVNELMDRDVKVTSLKKLQGMIWQDAFESGAMRAPLFDDVLPFLQRCRDSGISVRIYSSGSVQAQQLFFGHTLAGNLLPYFDGFHDTTCGPKTDSGSYFKIAREFGRDAADLVFVSDVTAELDAAREAGLRTILCRRPGNPPATGQHQHPGWRGTLTAMLDDLLGDETGVGIRQ